MLLVGPRHTLVEHGGDWLGNLSTFGIDLKRDGTVIDQGRAANVLGGPLSALRHLVEVLASDPVNPPLAAGEIVTTGTLTRAFPVAPGETWTTELSGIALDGIAIRFA
jgi:2-oxo-3-hexenedioate decarboxylase